MDENPLRNLSKRRAELRIVELETETLTELVKMPDVRTYAGLRDKALIFLTIDAGIRPKEACQLTKQDFNAHTLEVFIRAEVAKTRNQRILPVSQATASLISQLIAVRPREWIDKTPIFASADGTIRNRHTWGDRLEKYGNQLGVKIRPYDLRHGILFLSALGVEKYEGTAFPV